MRKIGVLIAMFFLVACGDAGNGGDESPDASVLPDASLLDARGPGAVGDGGTQDMDAQTHTACGVGQNATICEFATELCTIVDDNGVLTPTCVDLPDHCDTDLRQCDECGAGCEAPTDSCSNDPAMNTIVCN